MPKNALFFQKNCKNRQVQRALLPDPPLAVLDWFQRFENSNVQIGPRSNKLKQFGSGLFYMKSD